jgi:hypothetical protein
MLAPRSQSALPIFRFPIEQGIVKLPKSSYLRGRFCWRITLHFFEKTIFSSSLSLLLFSSFSSGGRKV